VFGSLDALQGKRIAVSWAHSPSYGKPLSVPQGLIGLLTRFGADVTLAHPEGYDLLPEVLDMARENASRSGGRFVRTHSMQEAFSGAEVVYPKSWAPLSVMQERTRLLSAGDRQGLGALEKDCLARNLSHADWECTRELMDRTRDGAALYMHCLPADISQVSCERGEVSKDVFEQYRLETYKQASMKPFVIAAMIFLSRVPSPMRALEEMLTRQRPHSRDGL
jgi:knotted carbamoyltransferase YgeW